MRLGKIVRELNVGLSTVAKFLQKKGFDVSEDPNYRISEEEVDLLYKEFSKDKAFKKDSEKSRQQQKKKMKEKKDSVSIMNDDEQSVKIEAPVIGIKQVGMIDIDSVNKPKGNNKTEKKPEVKKEVKEAPENQVAENVVAQSAESVSEHVAPEKTKPAAVPEPTNVVAETTEKKEPDTDVQSADDEVFRLSPKSPGVKLNVLGKLDLDSINSKTRPDKKSKAEKNKMRDKQNQQKNAQKGGGNGEKKKRNRIAQGEKVDIANFKNGEKKGGGQGNNGGQNGNAGNNGEKNRKKNGKNKNNNNNNVKAEISDEAVQKQIKETLARLTNKGQNSKGAKHRRDKRELQSQKQQELEEQERLEQNKLKITEFVTVSELATMMDVPVTKVIGTCMSLGLMVSINQRLDAETINIVADEFGFETEYISAEVAEAIQEEEDNEEDLVSRPPIVTVMGHVDHGKTSLLDYIRQTNVIAGEAGGITQHIGAYNVTLSNGQQITFLDTPGHEAFTAMRARGAKVTDLAIIIVAADDDVMPQTKEAINHASVAGVPIVFAINKIDKPTANPDKIKESLANLNYLVEEWGGKYQSQDIAAKKGIGVPELMEKVLLEAEMLDLKANPNRKATGSIIESQLDKGRGYVSTVLVSNGTLRVGDVVVAGTHHGKIKAMFNERNQRIKEAKPSEPALILGLNGAPQAGDNFNVMDTEQEARDIANKREQLQREQGLRTSKHLTLDEIGRRIALGNFQELNVIVKGDVDGSIEALSDSILKLSTEQIQVNVIHKAVGQISESDVMLAAASNAIIIGFQVRPSQAARKIAEKEDIDIRLYSIIYDAIEEIKDAMEGMLSPELKEEITGTAEIQNVFKITKVGTVAGCLVREGKIKRGNKVRVIRDGIVIFTGDLASLKRFKDDVKEVVTGYECGLNIQGYNDLKVGDIIEGFEQVEVARKL